ncbi:MAG TPA: Gfo/Idh/MocA family oxidoreductase [Armatimonadota bacterium]|nr:Gfo/Idh/MocA family oxidoreductase [Armatimonadota bacterium]
MGRPRKVRLALVRCDTHGYYYGALMAPCDPTPLGKHNKIVHFYATDWYDDKHIILPTCDDFESVKCYDRDPERARHFSETFLGKPRVCEALDEMTSDIDAAFISDCDGGGGDHLALATPFLERCIPTFVDKPFALTLQDARAMVDLACKHHAPLYSASILSEVVAADSFKRRFDEIGPQGANWTELAQAAVGMQCRPEEIGGVKLGVVKGVGGAMSQENIAARDRLGGIEDRLAYIIHGIALALNVFGKGVEWVEAMGTLPLEYLHLHLANGRDVIILNTGVDVFPERCNFYVEAYSKLGAIHSGPIGDPEFLRGAARIVGKLRDMVRTGKPPTAYPDMLEHIVVVEAAQIAHRTGQRVALSEVMG